MFGTWESWVRVPLTRPIYEETTHAGRYYYPQLISSEDHLRENIKYMQRMRYKPDFAPVIASMEDEIRKYHHNHALDLAELGRPRYNWERFYRSIEHECALTEWKGKVVCTLCGTPRS